MEDTRHVYCRYQGAGEQAAPLSVEPLLQLRHQLLGQLGVLLGLLGFPRYKPVGLLDELGAQNSLHADLSYRQPGPLSEEVSRHQWAASAP